MIICARQLVARAREYKTIFYILFVDIRKGHDSILCQVLWVVLLKYGCYDDYHRVGNESRVNSKPNNTIF